MGFQDRKTHNNVRDKNAHLLSLKAPLSVAWKVSVHASLYDIEIEEYPFSGALDQLAGLTIQKTALNWGCTRAVVCTPQSTSEFP